jgi:hypothetical protein
MDILKLLAQQILQPGQPWLQGEYVMSAEKGQYSIGPYSTSGQLPFQPMMLNIAISAPIPTPVGTPAPKAAITPIQSPPTGFGAAPTTGIYTGIGGGRPRGSTGVEGCIDG